MLRKSGRHAVALTLAAVLLAGAPAAAATAGQERLGWLAQAWQWVQALWLGNGSPLDPDRASRSKKDNGLCIDPDGAPCAASTDSDAGLHIDPDG